MVRRIIDGVSELSSFIAGMCLLFLVFGTTYDVVQRRITGRGVPGVIEYAEIFLIALVYLSIANTQRVGGHVASTILSDRLPARISLALEMIGLLVVAAMIVPIIQRAYAIAMISFVEKEFRLGSAAVTLWPSRAAMALGLLLLVIQILLRIARLAQQFRHAAGTTRLESEQFRLETLI
jgi:TRAP-type C4-dicarboxylate transport system permease small subunit